MTDARCEPPEGKRQSMTRHWIQLEDNADALVPAIWFLDGFQGYWTWGGEQRPAEKVAAAGWRYIGPAHTPTEVEALRQKYQDDMRAAIVQVGQWSQRSGQLEGERDAVAIAFRKLGAVLRVNMLRWVPGTSHGEIDAAIDACLGPVARRVLSDHIPDAGKMVEPPHVKDCLTTQAAYRAGAAEMRERAAETAEKAVWCPCGGPPCQTPAGHGCGVSPAEGVEVAAAIRALPLPASGWRDMDDKPPRPMPVLYWFGKRWWHNADGTRATLDPTRDPAERTEAGWWSGEEWRESGTGHDLFEPWREERDLPTAWMPLPAAPLSAKEPSHDR